MNQAEILPKRGKGIVLLPIRDYWGTGKETFYFKPSYLHEMKRVVWAKETERGQTTLFPLMAEILSLGEKNPVIYSSFVTCCCVLL